MPGGRMPNCPASASKGFSSTPVKTSQGQDYHTSNGLDDGVLSDDEDTFSLLSPIYHDSFDSDEDLEPSPAQHTSPMQSDKSRASVSPVRYCWIFQAKDSQSKTINWTIDKTESDRQNVSIEQNIYIYNCLSVFVTDVSYQEHLQSKCWMQLWILQAHIISVHGKCGWWTKPKKTVSNRKRNQRRQATVLTPKHTFLLHPVWVEHFLSFDLGAYTEGKRRTTRKGAGTEEDCHGREDPRMAKDEKRTGR